MVWFNIKKLERKLVTNNYPHTLGYCYIIVLLTALTILYLHPNTSRGREELKIIGFIVSLLISFWGFRKTLIVNQQGGNKDFYMKFFSLSLVTGLRVFGGLIAFALILRGSRFLLQSYFPFPEGQMLNEVSKLLLVPAVFLIFFILLINAFKRVNE